MTQLHKTASTLHILKPLVAKAVDNFLPCTLRLFGRHALRLDASRDSRLLRMARDAPPCGPEEETATLAQLCHGKLFVSADEEA